MTLEDETSGVQRVVHRPDVSAGGPELSQGGTDQRETSTTAAEVLVVGSEEWAIADATVQLRRAGRTVHRCSDNVSLPFPCNAMIPGRGCPLDNHPVDVVLDIRSRADSQPALSEMGAVCGLRDGIPLVIGGLSDMSTFAPFGDKVPPTGDVVASCDEAVRRHA